MLKNYIDLNERRDANRKLPKLLVEGLLLGGTGLGVLALIFEIAADAFSVAAYQTLLAIHGAAGYHVIATWAFIALSVLLFLGIVPAYKAGAYLRPNAGGSGPLVEAIGPERLRWLSWGGTSLFFLDAILTIIISSISAADVIMLIYPELAAYRIALAELFAFFIMAVLVAMGPKRAVPLFLIGGGLFTIFTFGALSLVGVMAVTHPEWSFLTEGIVSRLQSTGVVPVVVRAQQDLSAIGTVLFFQLFFSSMASAMLGFSGYEVIPASGKHAAHPKWKVINTALTLAAVFLIGTGVVQLFAAQQWKIPSTEGYSTLLIEYEIVGTQTLGRGITPTDFTPTDEDRQSAAELYDQRAIDQAAQQLRGGEQASREHLTNLTRDEYIANVAQNLAATRVLNGSIQGTIGESFLLIAGVLLAIILLLAQGGGYVGGAAVAANASRLGRLPHIFADDRIGVAVIWVISAVLIPIIREVVVVEGYYAFGFVSAFVITSTTIFFVRDDALHARGIDPRSGEARSIRFAGLRGMFASYIMAIVLVTQKTEALVTILLAGAAITLFQIYVARGGLKPGTAMQKSIHAPPGTRKIQYEMGIQRAHDEARQRGIADAVLELIKSGSCAKFNVEPHRIMTLVSYLYNVDPVLFSQNGHHTAHDRIEEPNVGLEESYQAAYGQREEIVKHVEKYSHIGIFMFVHNYYLNWVSVDQGRDSDIVQQAMLDILFPQTPHERIWKEYKAFEPQHYPEAIWQFSRQRYLWAKDQWPNLSGRITTVWVLQDFGLIPKEVDVQTVISIANGRHFKLVKIHTDPDAEELEIEKETVDKEEITHDDELADDLPGGTQRGKEGKQVGQ